MQCFKVHGFSTGNDRSVRVVKGSKLYALAEAQGKIPGTKKSKSVKQKTEKEESFYFSVPGRLKGILYSFIVPFALPSINRNNQRDGVGNRLREKKLLK